MYARIEILAIGIKTFLPCLPIAKSYVTSFQTKTTQNHCRNHCKSAELQVFTFFALHANIILCRPLLY